MAEETKKPAAKAAAPKVAKVAKVAKEVVDQVRNDRKTRRGYVVSDKMDKTIVVLVEDRKKHPLYGKVIPISKKIKAHDENNTAGIGDLVEIDETRPLSATKNWRLVEILERAK
jgi:small subunit ribosomal protein S17